MEYWTAYTGFLSYVIMGVIGAFIYNIVAGITGGIIIELKDT